MTAIPYSKERWRWQIIDGPDVIIVWLDSDGLHSRRYSGSKPIVHAEQKINWTDFISMTEGQKKLL